MWERRPARDVMKVTTRTSSNLPTVRSRLQEAPSNRKVVKPAMARDLSMQKKGEVKKPVYLDLGRRRILMRNPRNASPATRDQNLSPSGIWADTNLLVSPVISAIPSMPNPIHPPTSKSPISVTPATDTSGHNRTNSHIIRSVRAGSNAAVAMRSMEALGPRW